MFTGLIEAVRPIEAIRPTATGRTLVISCPAWQGELVRGESICINGVCLTVSRLEKQSVHFDVMAETLRRSTLGNLQMGDQVNLERALRATGRLGGHIVQGHIDGTGTVQRVEKAGNEYQLWIQAVAEIMRFMIEKGSVAIDGVSLTIGEVDKERFCVYLIPTTLEETTLRQRRTGDKVNVEADLISKWINKRLDAVMGPSGGRGGLTRERLQEEGFI